MSDLDLEFLPEKITRGLIPFASAIVQVSVGGRHVSIKTLDNWRHLMRFGLGSALLLSLAASIFAQHASAEPQTRPAAKVHDPQIARQEPMPHLLYLPRAYGADGGGRRWPVVLFLHGSGESGHDLERVKKHGPPKLVSEGKQFPFILVSPQTDHGWKPEELGKLLDSIESQYAVDRSREYVTGLSMGGFGTWEMLAAFPNRFAAAVMICGGGNPEYAGKIKGTPLWVFHGEKDDVVPIQRSQTAVEAIKELNGDVQFTSYPETRHDSWTATYNNPKVYRWMLKHTRKPGKATASAPAASQPGR